MKEARFDSGKKRSSETSVRTAKAVGWGKAVL